MPRCPALSVCLAVSTLATLVSAQPLPSPVRSIYENGVWDVDVVPWVGEGTHSQRTPEGLLVADTSAALGSGRFYSLDWAADPTKGAAVEARVKAITCSQPWGCAIMVSDGIHEEGLTIYPDRLELVNAKQSLPFEAAGGFHTYRLEIKGEDLWLLVDGELVIDGRGKFTTPAQCDPPRNRCGFGCGASAATGEAIWQWVRYESDAPEREKPQMPKVPGLHVETGETVEITPGASYASLFKFRDGRLYAAGKLSTDGGRTWAPGPGVGTNAYEFEDGEIVGLGFLPKSLGDGVFEYPLVRSTDGGKTFTSETARMTIPEGTGGTGDDGKPYEGPPADHAIVRLRDGSLLAAMYGYFKGDTVLCPAYPPEWKLYKYRTFVVRSTDRGRTWDYWATVAYDPEVGCESFCEPDLLMLPNGDILCFMRTGGVPPKYVTPLYLSRSTDDGRTWSKPEPIADRGVWPSACHMESGIIVVTYGRPDNWLAFSLDNGRTWVGHFCFYQGATTSYNSVEEVAPGRLLVVYDQRGLDADGNLSSGVVGTFFEVRRVSAEG